MKGCDVSQREDPAVQQVDQKSDQLGSVTVGSEDRAQDVGKIDASEAETLTARQHRRQGQRGHPAPEQPIAPVHTRTCCTCEPSRRSGRCRGIGDSPSNRRASEMAALISPTWVKAWGKLPSAAPVPGSISSAKSPTSLA